MHEHSMASPRALPPGWIDKAATLDDVDRAVDLMNARSQRLHGENQVTREDIEGRWRSPRLDLARDLRLVFDDRADLAGIANAQNPGEPYASIGCSGVTHPRHEGRADVWDWLHAWALDRVQELMRFAPAGIRVSAVSSTAFEDVARRASLERAGFAAIRIANHMRIDLAEDVGSAEWPDGVSLRTSDVDLDLPDIVALYQVAWRDHWGYVEEPFDQTLADWAESVKRAGERFDPTLWFLATAGGEIIGMSLCASHIAGDATRGYVQGLGVHPQWRRHGVALALLRHSFGEFRRRGYAAVELDMDSENLTGALRVYERAGMRAIRQSVFYERELRPGVDLATREARGA